MSYYFNITFLTELMMLAMVFHVIKYKGFTRDQKKWYILTFISIMVCTLAEYAVHCGYYNKAFIVPLTIATVIQFSVAPLLGLFFSAALGIRDIEKFTIGFFIANFIVEGVSAPFGWIFYFDAEGYHRGGLFFVYGLFYVFSIVYLIINMNIVGKRFHRRDTITIVMILLIIIAGIVPMTVFKLNVTYIAIAISAILCYVYYNDLVQQDIQEELVINQQKISDMQSHMISGLANLIENRDMDTGGHISRTSYYVRMISQFAREDGVYADVIDDSFISNICMLAPLHDIGKIIIPDSILKKPGKLTVEEFDHMKQHAAAGGAVITEVLNGVTDEQYLTFASDIVTYHHEKWDGSGYPYGLKGEEIPLPARIMAIADVFDALVSERCYKKPIMPEEALKIIEQESGTHFDPNLVKVFINHKDAFLLK